MRVEAHLLAPCAVRHPDVLPPNRLVVQKEALDQKPIDSTNNPERLRNHMAHPSLGTLPERVEKGQATLPYRNTERGDYILFASQMGSPQ